jgi:hypothetical protein
LDQEVQRRGDSHLAMGRLHVRSRLTWNEAETSFLVIHFGGLDFHAVLRKAPSPEEYNALKKELFDLYATGFLADVAALATEEFKGEIYRLPDLFVEEQRRIIGIVLRDRFIDYQQSFERLAEPDEDMIHLLGQLHFPIPRPMRAAAALLLDQRILQEIPRSESGESLKRIKHFLSRGKVWGYQPDREAIGRALAHELEGVLSELNPSSDLPALTSRTGRLLEAASLLGIALDLWNPQNRLLHAYAEMQAAYTLSAPLGGAFAQLAQQLGVNPALLGWRP